MDLVRRLLGIRSPRRELGLDPRLEITQPVLQSPPRIIVCSACHHGKGEHDWDGRCPVGGLSWRVGA